MKYNNAAFTKVLKTFIIIFALAFSYNMNAQAPPPSGSPGIPPINPPSDSIPLDGGLAILVIGAAAFGVKKLRTKETA